MAPRKQAVNPNPLSEMDIVAISTGRVSYYIRGVHPLIYGAMSSKVKFELLYPKGKKTAAEKSSRPKHEPLPEYKGTLYTQPAGETLLNFPATAFKRAIASSAIDLGGAKRAQLDRLMWVLSERVPIWGVPMLRMDVVRSADQARTPDIRTRACLREWATKLDLCFVQPTVNVTVVTNLLVAAGLIRGIGDFRVEKGAGNFGQFIVVNDDDEDWHRIVAEGGRAAQEAAYEAPTCYDEETERLYLQWQEEYVKRGHDKSAKASKGNGKTEPLVVT